MRKKYSALLMACTVLSALTVCSAQPSAATTESGTEAVQGEGAADTETIVFAGGAGTEEEPYQIADVTQLLAFADRVNDGSCGGYVDQYIQLTSDLDLTGIDWTPIGNMDDMETNSTMFLGVFDGDGHTIANLTYESDEFHCGAGLFGISCGTIKNLTVQDVTVAVTEGTSMAIGGVIGYNMGSVENVTVETAFVTGNNCTGGIIGGNSNGAVTNCLAKDVTVTVIGDNDFSGGLIQDDIAECGGLVIGGGFGGTIDGCFASGVVQAEGNEPVGLGGIGGCLEMMDSIINCSADVTIKSMNGGHAIGGLCGYAGTHSDPDICLETEGFSTTAYPGVIENCTVDVEIEAKDATHVGGLVGTGLYYYGEETAFAIENCTVTGSIRGAATPGAIAGRAEGSTIRNCSFQLLVDGETAASEIGETTCMYESADQ